MRIRARVPSALRSAAFRFALMLAGLVGLGAGALLLTVERQIGHYAREASDGMLHAESSVLAGEYATLGLSGLTDAIARHGGVGEDPPYRYLLQDAAGRRLAGDLPASAARNGSGYVLHYAESASDRSGERMVARRTNLPGGLVLVVATDSFDVQDLRDQLGRFTLISGLAIAALAVLGGFLVGGAFLKRLNGVNLAIERIIAGDRSERLPMIGFGPEFDDLAFNLNRMLDRNAAAMEALRQVSTDIAHDLRTPLTRLHQPLERMLATGGDRVGIEEALTQTDALLTTFQALLRIGTLEGGVGRQRFTTVDLSEVMDRVCQAYVPVVEDAGQTLTAEHLPDVSVLGDAELLAQLVTNLIENAIVHTPPGTRIVSRLRLVDGTPVAEICDDGPGIPAEEREKVFRRFYRRDASRSTDGAGLGLALVSAVSALHQAACSIPDADGGLCVRIEFPPSR